MSKIELYFIHRLLKLGKVGQMRTFVQEYLRNKIALKIHVKSLENSIIKTKGYNLYIPLRISPS